MRVCENEVYSGEMALDWFSPDGDGYDTVVYFHGGGLTSGDKADANYRAIAADFAAHGLGFVSVNYRLYPSAHFPDFLLDAANAVAYVKKHASSHGANGTLLVSGQSAGAWMSLMLCLNRAYLDSVGVNPGEIKAWLIDSAQTTSHFNVIANERGLDPRLQVIDEFAPLSFVNAQTSFSRMLLIHYEDDIPCRPEQNRLLCKAILNFNENADIVPVELPGGHCDGSCRVNANGRYPFAEVALRFLGRE